MLDLRNLSASLEIAIPRHRYDHGGGAPGTIMFDTTSELSERVRLGENSFFETKEIRVAGKRVSAPVDDDLADELAAYANSNGGVLIFRAPDGSCEALDAIESYLLEQCDSVTPPLTPVIEKRFLPTSTGEQAAVIKVELGRSLFVHESPGGYFHRVGSSKRKITPDYLGRLFQQRSQARLIRFDEQIVPASSIADLKEPLWRRFGTRYSEADPPEVFLNKLGLARRDDDGVWRPTVSGVLLASDDPRKFIPNAFIQAVAYRGTSPVPSVESRAYQLDAADITGPIDRQIIEALRFVARNMRIEAEKSIGRKDIPQFSLAAVFEALTNAVAHRDYAIYGSKIRLRLYSDRLELYSPGALANTMTIESLVARQSARNEVLTSLLARCVVPAGVPGLETDRATIMDKRGEGVRIIFQATEALSGRLPEYRLIDGEELLLTIPAASAEG